MDTGKTQEKTYTKQEAIRFLLVTGRQSADITFISKDGQSYEMSFLSYKKINDMLWDDEIKDSLSWSCVADALTKIDWQPQHIKEIEGILHKDKLDPKTKEMINQLGQLERDISAEGFISPQNEKKFADLCTQLKEANEAINDKE